MKKKGKYTISGHVQGVGFRFFVYQRATELNLKGYAKNLFNGNVEVIAEGDEINLDILLNFLKKGPSRSYVECVHTEFSEFTGKYKDFDIK